MLDCGGASVEEELGFRQDGADGGSTEGNAGGNVEKHPPRVVPGDNIEVQYLWEGGLSRRPSREKGVTNGRDKVTLGGSRGHQLG